MLLIFAYVAVDAADAATYTLSRLSRQAWNGRLLPRAIRMLRCYHAADAIERA